MCKSCFLATTMGVLFVALVGCNRSSSTSTNKQSEPASSNETSKIDDEITTALAQLPAEDRLQAEAQKYCAVEKENRLGSMGAPVKVMIEGEPVFLCCAGCEDSARENPKETLATIAKLKDANRADQQK
jgi:hypothetical protein